MWDCPCALALWGGVMRCPPSSIVRGPWSIMHNCDCMAATIFSTSRSCATCRNASARDEGCLRVRTPHRTFPIINERIPATRVQSNASALLWRSIALENVSRMPANTGSGIGGLVAPNTTPTLWVTIGNTASSIQTVALCKGRAEVWQTTSAALRFFVMYGIVSKFFCLRQGTWKRDKNHTYENIQVPLNSVKEQQFLGLLGAHGPGYMGPAATMWVPMGAQVPVLSPNNHLNPSQGR